MAGNVTILTKADLSTCVGLNETALTVIEDAFEALANGKIVMPPILSMDLPMVNGEVDVKTAYIEGFDGFAIKVSPGFFNNPQLGLPSLNGLMILFDAKTGLVKSVLLDNGYLTDVRTAAAGGVAAKHLAPSQVNCATVFGGGVQARMQLKAAHIAKPFSKAFIWARNFEKADQAAKELSADLSIPVVATHDPGRAVAESQLAITTTPATSPIFKKEWLHPGLHITAMGSDQEGKNEIEAEALMAADLYVSDRISQCEKLGELRSALNAGWTAPDIPELGQIITGQKSGRMSDDDVTICDLTGTGVQDTAIAAHAFKVATSEDMGQIFETDGTTK